MDGTVIRNTDSVKYLCMLNDGMDEFERIERLEDDKSVSWIEADFLKAKLIEGLSIADVSAKFTDSVEIIQNLEQVLTYLRGKGIQSVLVTAGPIQVANILRTEFGFDAAYASLYEIKEQKFTGRITSHMGSEGKVDALNDCCARNSIRPVQCIAVGNSGSDIGIFENCAKSIAINYSESLQGKASEYIITDDLQDIIAIIENWLSE